MQNGRSIAGIFCAACLSVAASTLAEAQGRAALSGLGGVGKTQTVLEYAHRHFDSYLYTFWTLADSRDSIVSGYGKIAGLLKLPAAGTQNQMLTVEAVKDWLNVHKGWLLILDNADDLGMAREFIPTGKKRSCATNNPGTCSRCSGPAR